MKVLTPIKAIRAKCLDCCCGQVTEVRLCPSKNCTLHPYRMGHRPKAINNTTDTVNEENIVDSPIVFSKKSELMP